MTADPRSDEHFIDVLDDLRQLVRLKASGYEAARVSLVLRQLLLDGGGLYPRISRAHGVVPRFAVGSVGYAYRREDFDGWLRGPWLDPELSGAFIRETRSAAEPAGIVVPEMIATMKDSQEVNLQNLLAESVAEVMDGAGPKVTVRDLIDYYANKAGGAHWDIHDRRGRAHKTLVGASPELELIFRASLVAVGRIVLRSADPLANLMMVRASGVLPKEFLRSRSSRPTDPGRSQV